MSTTIVSRFNIPISSLIAFVVGVLFMVVSGYFLIEGLSEFSGSRTARNMLIFGGVLVQVGESVSFMYAVGLSNHISWRIIMFSLGVLLFVFSVIVVTLAQKTAMQTGETAANAIDERATLLRSQIDSLDEAIASYRDNAGQQSQSIYAQSRELGQDSINRAVKLEQQKMELRNELFLITQQRRQTSSDFFNTLEEVSSLPAKETEFYFFVGRSLVFELAGIIFLSVAAYKKKERDALQEWTDPTRPTRPDRVGSGLDPRSGDPTQLGSMSTDPVMLAHVKDDESDPTGLPLPTDADIFNEPEPMDIDTKEMIEKVENALSKPNKYWADSKVRQLRESRIDSEGIDEKQELDQLVTLICRLYEEGEINSVGRDSVRKTINEHYGKSIGSRKAMEISRLVKQRLSMTPA